MSAMQLSNRLLIKEALFVLKAMCKAENHQHTDDIIDMVEDVCNA